MGGSDAPSNLRAVCSVCNEGARNLMLDRPSLQKLLIQVRRGTGGDQLEVAEVADYQVSGAGGEVDGQAGEVEDAALS